METNDTNQVVYEVVDDRDIVTKHQKHNATIMVNLETGSGISYWVMEQNSSLIDGGHTPAQNIPNIEAFLQSLESILSASIELGALPEDEMLSLWINLEGLGKDLYDRFLPEELRRHALNWPMGATISIGTNEKWIPWELIYDGQNFWGSKFNLARIPKIPRHDAYNMNDRPVVRNSKQNVSKVVNVIGGKLGSDVIVERIRKLFFQIEPRVVSTKERTTLAEVLQAMEDADLVHFTCHGHTHPSPSLQLGDDARSPVHTLNVFSLNRLRNISHSIIFANACSSVGVGSLLEEIRNFGWEFYKKGSDAYIGTLGPVPIKYATEFAEIFYQKLLAGVTVGDALLYAKQMAQRKNPYWLLYCLYGNPQARKLCPIINQNL